MTVPQRTGPGGGSAGSEQDRRSRPPIFTRPLLLMFLADFGSLLSFFMLLSVVPLYAVSGGANRADAGFTTSALTFATVAGELITPRLLGRFGYRTVFAAGLLLLGLPDLALAASARMPLIIAASAVRGLGFALSAVAGSAIIVSLMPAERRGEALGLYGVGAGVPSVVALPLGVWLAGHVGYPTVFIIAAVAAVVGFAALSILPGRWPASPGTGDPAPQAGQEQADQEQARSGPDGILDALRTAALVGPAVSFAITAMAAAATLTFVPLALAHHSSDVTPFALLAQPAMAALARWQAGRYGDRHGPARLLIPGVVAVAVGMVGVGLALTLAPVAVIPAMVVFGTGFGTVQNSSLALMYSRVPASRYSIVSALWNLAYDAGLGVGAAGFGVLATRTGYPVAFALTAALMTTSVAVAWRDRPPANGDGSLK
jgi:predicted MFS family arabinose efflux permease